MTTRLPAYTPSASRSSPREITRSPGHRAADAPDAVDPMEHSEYGGWERVGHCFVHGPVPVSLAGRCKTS